MALCANSATVSFFEISELILQKVTLMELWADWQEATRLRIDRKVMEI